MSRTPWPVLEEMRWRLRPLGKPRRASSVRTYVCRRVECVNASGGRTSHLFAQKMTSSSRRERGHAASSASLQPDNHPGTKGIRKGPSKRGANEEPDTT